MPDWKFKLEIDDNLGSPFEISNENAGFNLKLGRFNKSEITYTVRNLNNIRTKIVRGNEVRVYGDIISLDGLVGLWHFQDDALDESGKGNNGTITGATFVTGKIGKALSFEGVDNDVTIADSISLRPAQITVASWVNPTSVGNFMTIASKFSGFVQGAYFMRIENTAEGKRFEFFITDGVSNIEAVSTTVATIDTWFHVVGTYDGSQLKIYVNGVLERTVNTSITISYGTNGSLFLGRLGDGSNRLNGKLDEVRIYNRALTASEVTDLHNSTNPTIRQFTGIQIDDVVVGTYKDFIQVLGQDTFKRRRLKRSVNKKYPDQEVKLTAEDIVLNFMGGGFTTTGMQNIGVSQPFNMVKEIVDHALDRVTSSSFSEIFMKPDKSVIMRSLQTEDSGITLTDTNIFEPESVQVKRSIADSAGIVTVVGGLSTETFDLNKRIIAQSRIPSAPANLLNEEFVLTDERFTTWKGAKEKSLTIINEIGKDFFMFPNSILVKDMTSLPRAGTLVNINSSKLGISNVKFVVDEIGIKAEAGATGVTYIELKLGETEQTELETLALLQQVWESDKRKQLDADAITNQAPFSVPIKFAPTITVSIATRDVVTNPYVWGDGADETEWGSASWA